MTTATELATWRNGTPTGGPEGDGRYPLTYADGVTYLVFCPAAQALNPLVTEQPVQVFAEAAQAAAATATTKAGQAETSRIAAAAAASNAATSASTALTNKNAAETSATTASTAATAAAASNTAAADWAAVANDAATAAELSATAAAAAAAEFDNGLYYTKVEADGRYRLLSTSITWTELAGKPSTFVPSAHNHVITDVTGLQSALDAKLATASFTWSGLSGKPTTFTPSAHTHVINDVTGLQTALDGKQSSLGYTPMIRDTQTITDWNNAVTNGVFMALAAANAPAETSGWLIGRVTVHNNDWITQEVWDFTNNPAQNVFRRQKSAGTWGSWSNQGSLGGTIRSQGGTSVLTGTGIEMFLAADRGYLITYDRTNNVWKDTRIYGAQVEMWAAGAVVAKALTTGFEIQGHLLANSEGFFLANSPMRRVGQNQRLTADAAAWANDPRVFVQSGDPGAQAADGDLWIW